MGVKAVNEDHEIMMITTEGIIIQLRCDEISTYGRITSGVKLINLKQGEVVAQIAKVRQTENNNSNAEDEEAEETGVETVDEVTDETNEDADE